MSIYVKYELPQYPVMSWRKYVLTYIDLRIFDVENDICVCQEFVEFVYRSMNL